MKTKLKTKINRETVDKTKPTQPIYLLEHEFFN